jgi:hypothetical protein
MTERVGCVLSGIFRCPYIRDTPYTRATRCVGFGYL